MIHTEYPKISIVTPSFNQGQFLEATIQSILSQNYPNLEYIIIDGGSSDNSIEIIKKYERCLHFWCSEPDEGQYAAINKGFLHATGDILAWLNSDDMYFPWTFRTVASIMTALPELEWLTSLTPCFWDWHGFCLNTKSLTGYSREAFLDGCYLPWGRNAIGWGIQQESTFWTQNLWEKVGGLRSTEFGLAGDFDLWTRFYDYTDLYGTSSLLGGFRYQHHQRVSQKERYKHEAEQALKNMRQHFNWSPSLTRMFAVTLKLPKIPRVRHFVKSAYQYTGKRVVRKKGDSPEGYWGIEKYSFYGDISW